MDDRLNREGFDRLNSAEKETLMRELAERFRMSFLGLQRFFRWGNGITTGVFEKDGMEFSFVPGDTVTIGWDRFVVGIDEENQVEMNETFEEYEYEGTVEDFLRQSLAPVHQAVIPPMLVGRNLQEIGWEPVALDDPRLTCHEDWMDEFQRGKLEGLSTLILHDGARFTQVDGVWQAAIYHEMDYPQLKEMLKVHGYSLPTADEWAYLCGGGCRTLFPWGDGIDYAMHLRYFVDQEVDDRPYDMEEPNFFGLSIAYDPYIWEVVEADRFTVCGGDGGCNICGGMGPLMSYLPCSPHHRPEVRDGGDLSDMNGNYDFFRYIIRLDN